MNAEEIDERIEVKQAARIILEAIIYSKDYPLNLNVYKERLNRLSTSVKHIIFNENEYEQIAVKYLAGINYKYFMKYDKDIDRFDLKLENYWSDEPDYFYYDNTFDAVSTLINIFNEVLDGCNQKIIFLDRLRRLAE